MVAPQSTDTVAIICLPAPRLSDSTRSLTRRQGYRSTLPQEPDGCPSHASIRLPVRCDSPLIQRYGFMPDDEGLSLGATPKLRILGVAFPSSLSAVNGAPDSALIHEGDPQTPRFGGRPFPTHDSRFNSHLFISLDLTTATPKLRISGVAFFRGPLIG